MSTVATLVVRVAGDMKDAEKAFAGLESAGKGLERACGGLGTSLSAVGRRPGARASAGPSPDARRRPPGSALSAVETGLGKVARRARAASRSCCRACRHAGRRSAPAFGGFMPVGMVLGGVTAGALALGAAARRDRRRPGRAGEERGRCRRCAAGPLAAVRHLGREPLPLPVRRAADRRLGRQDRRVDPQARAPTSPPAARRPARPSKASASRWPRPQPQAGGSLHADRRRPRQDPRCRAARRRRRRDLRQGLARRLAARDRRSARPDEGGRHLRRHDLDRARDRRRSLQRHDGPAVDDVRGLQARDRGRRPAGDDGLRRGAARPGDRLRCRRPGRRRRRSRAPSRRSRSRSPWRCAQIIGDVGGRVRHRRTSSRLFAKVPSSALQAMQDLTAARQRMASVAQAAAFDLDAFDPAVADGTQAIGRRGRRRPPTQLAKDLAGTLARVKAEIERRGGGHEGRTRGPRPARRGGRADETLKKLIDTLSGATDVARRREDDGGADRAHRRAG